MTTQQRYPLLLRVEWLVYVALFLLTLGTIALTCWNHPLFPFQTSSLEWSNAWLMATVVDYYGACLCLCGVIVSSEATWMAGIIWSVLCCLLGSPVCCLWVLWKIGRGKTLRLEPSINGESYMHPLVD